ERQPGRRRLPQMLGVQPEDLAQPCCRLPHQRRFTRSIQPNKRNHGPAGGVILTAAAPGEESPKQALPKYPGSTGGLAYSREAAIACQLPAQPAPQEVPAHPGCTVAKCCHAVAEERRRQAWQPCFN